MEKKVIKKKLIVVLDFVCSLYALLGISIIVGLHAYVPFFPVLFLFDLCMLIGYPLFLRLFLKRKWFDCAENDYLRIKYILIPWIIIESILFLCYPKEVLYILQTSIL